MSSQYNSSVQTVDISSTLETLETIVVSENWDSHKHEEGGQSDIKTKAKSYSGENEFFHRIQLRTSSLT